MKRLLDVVKRVAPVVAFASLIVAVQFLCGDGSMHYAFFGALGGLLGGDKIEDAIHGQYGQVLGPLQDIMKQLQSAYTADRAQYSKGFADMESGFSESIKSMRADLGDMQTEAMGLLETGADALYSQITRAGEESRGREIAAQTATGLSGTSFGRQAVSSVEEKTAQELGLAEYGVNQQLASTTERFGLQTQALDQYGIEGINALKQARIGGSSALDQSWLEMVMNQGGRIAGVQTDYANQIIGNERNNMNMGMNVTAGIMQGLGF